MNRKIVFLILSIMGIITIILGSTYSALFRSNITDKNVYNTGVLEITSSNNGNIALNNKFPLTDDEGTKSIPYVFTLKNTGNLNYKLTSIKLVSTTNSNQISAQYIKVKLDDRPISILNNLSSKDYNLLNTNESITIFPGDSLSFSLRVWLDDFTPNTQIGKVFNAKIVTQGEAVQTSLALNTITKLGLESSLKTGTPDFSKSSCSSGCEENTVGIYKAKDDLGDSYYFRGDVTNNYVKFGKYAEDAYQQRNDSTGESTYTNSSACPSGNTCTKIASAGSDMYWRIVRINGDGTIRLIYDGTSAHPNGEVSTDREIGTSAFNRTISEPKYVGYMYDANISSTIKGVVDNWYKTYILDKEYSSSVADAIYCNDMSLDPDYNNTEKDIQYGAWDRIWDKNGKGAVLTCPQDKDKYTVINGTIPGGNGKLTYPVGLITADEMIMAGYHWNGENTKLYLYTGSGYWSASPSFFLSKSASSFLRDHADVFNADSDVDGNGFVNLRKAVRVSVSLKQDALNSGTGTSTDPFTYNPSKGTLKRLGLDTQVRTDVPDFSKTSCSSGCEEKTVGIYKAPDDLGDSYYFRGDVTNNYVKFAGFYWRIVRINGDGTIRLIYDGTSAHPNGEESMDREIGESAFNSTRNDLKYVGYMYDTNTSSTIKGVVDNWYKTNILDKGYGSSVADAIYCNDTSPEPFYAYGRIYDKKVILTCPQDKDKYTVINGTIPGGNEKLIYPVGLITADEMIMAGYPAFGEYKKNRKLYLYTGSWYWSATPSFAFSDDDSVFFANYDVRGNSVDSSYSVRVSVSLNSAAIKSGSGTASDPFVA